MRHASNQKKSAADRSARVQSKTRQLVIKVPAAAMAEIDRFSALMEIPKAEMLAHYREQMTQVALDFVEQYSNWAECWVYDDRAEARLIAAKMFADDPEMRSIVLSVESEPRSKEVRFENPSNPPEGPAPAHVPDDALFTLKLPRRIAERVRYLAEWESKTVEQFIAEAVLDVSSCTLDGASTAASDELEDDRKAVRALNAGKAVLP